MLDGNESAASAAFLSGSAGAGQLPIPALSPLSPLQQELGSNESMWANHASNPSETSSTLNPSDNHSTDSNDSQPEPMSWQLGGLMPFPVLNNISPPTVKLRNIAPNNESLPAIKTAAAAPKRRGRPPLAGKVPDLSKQTPKQLPGGKKPKMRGRKARRKRLTITKPLGRPPNAAKKALGRPVVNHALNGFSNNQNITQDERLVRLESLRENCSEELCENLRLSAAAIEEIYKEAENIYKEIILTDCTEEITENLQKKLTEERKIRQAQEELEDNTMTKSLCERILHLKMLDAPTGSPDSADDLLFLSGPSRQRLNEIRNALQLPPLDKPQNQSDLNEATGKFLRSVGLPADFASASFSMDDLKEMENGSDFKTVRKREESQNGPISSRPHPKELAKQLVQLLGPGAIPKAEKRAAQRARRAAQVDNMVEAQMEQMCFDYLHSSAKIPLDYVAIEPPVYHRLGFDADPAVEIAKLYENFVYSCFCKGGIRCFLCQNSVYGKHRLPAATNVAVPPHAMVYDYCFSCDQAYQLDFDAARNQHPRHKIDEGEPLSFGNLSLWTDFLSADEEQRLCRLMNACTWTEGESQCLRQDFGPSVNYDNHLVNLDNYRGLPNFSATILQKMSKWKDITEFQCVAISNIELTKERLSSVQARVEDEWMWGERVVILSLLADMVLTFSPRTWDRKEIYRPVRVEVPRRSLVMISENVRKNWNYSVLSADVHDKQIMVVFRELGATFRKAGDREGLGNDILRIAETYQGKPMNSRRGL